MLSIKSIYSELWQTQLCSCVTMNNVSGFLVGRLLFFEFAAAMEHYGRLGTDADVDHEVDEEEEEVDSSIGGLKLDTDQSRRPVPSLVLLTPETAEEMNSHPQPGTSRQMHSEEEIKLRGEFFRSGDEPATFSVRKRRKMPPTIKNLMGEAHVRFARGDLTGAETICMEVIKERKLCLL